MALQAEKRKLLRELLITMLLLTCGLCKLAIGGGVGAAVTYALLGKIGSDRTAPDRHYPLVYQRAREPVQGNRVYFGTCAAPEEGLSTNAERPRPPCTKGELPLPPKEDPPPTKGGGESSAEPLAV